MSTVDKILGGIEKVVLFLSAFLVAVMTINTVTGVFFRFVLNNAIPWTEELGRYLMIYVGFLGCYLASRDNSHVGIEMFVNLFKPGARLVFKAASRLVVIAFLVIVLAKSGEQLQLLKIQKSSALELPMAIPYAAVSVGIFLMLIENLAHLLKLFAKPSVTSGEGKQV